MSGWVKATKHKHEGMHGIDMSMRDRLNKNSSHKNLHKKVDNKKYEHHGFENQTFEHKV